MKSLLYSLFLISFCSHSLMAENGPNTETKPESNISSSTKKVIKKVGRKARDTSCEWTEDKAKCEKEKTEHQKANLEDKIDTKKRKMDQANKDYQDEVNKRK